MKKVIIIIAIVLIVIAGGVLGGLYFIGDQIIDGAIDMAVPTMEDIPEETQDIASGVNAAETSKQAEVTNTPETDTSVSAVANSTTGKTDVPKKETKPESVKKPVVSVKKMNEVKEKVTATDKVNAAAMVMSKLSSGEIDKLKGMLSGGLTAEEKKQAKDIAFSNFSSEEIKKIKEMYTKYMNENK